MSQHVLLSLFTRICQYQECQNQHPDNDFPHTVVHFGFFLFYPVFLSFQTSAGAGKCPIRRTPLEYQNPPHGARRIFVNRDFGYVFSRSIHAMRKSTMPCWRSAGMATPRGTFHHFARQLRQQQAQACWAMKTGCPRIGVCFPSLGGFAGARRMRTKSAAWRRIVSRPFSAM